MQHDYIYIYIYIYNMPHTETKMLAQTKQSNKF